MKLSLLIACLLCSSFQININLRSAVKDSPIIHPMKGNFIDLTQQSSETANNSMDNEIIYDADKVLVDIDNINNQAVDMKAKQSSMSEKEQQEFDQKMYAAGPQSYGMGDTDSLMSQFSHQKPPTTHQ